MLEIIGLKVVAIKGHKYVVPVRDEPKRLDDNVKPVFIFFDDEETFIELKEQNYSTFSDCSSSARTLHVYKDKEDYKELINSEDLTDVNTKI